MTKNFIKKLKRLGMIVSIPILVTISIYYFDKEIDIQKEKNGLLSEEISFLKEKCNLTSYSSSWGEIDAQRNIHKNDIKKLNEKISTAREELFHTREDNKKYKKTLEKLEVLLFKKEQLLKTIKETSLNENINCDSKISKIFKNVSNKNYKLKNNLYLCKENLSKKITEKKTLSKNKSKDFNRLINEYNILLKEKKEIKNKLSKKHSAKKKETLVEKNT